MLSRPLYEYRSDVNNNRSDWKNLTASAAFDIFRFVELQMNMFSVYSR